MYWCHGAVGSRPADARYWANNTGAGGSNAHSLASWTSNGTGSVYPQYWYHKSDGHRIRCAILKICYNINSTHCFKK